jgi:hypothetical protein
MYDQILFFRKISPGSPVCSDTGKACTGTAARGYVHRLTHPGEKYRDGKEDHFNGLGGFRGFLKRKPESEGGITRQKLSRYPAGYV